MLRAVQHTTRFFAHKNIAAVYCKYIFNDRYICDINTVGFHVRTILLDDFISEMRNDLLKRIAIDVNKWF